MVTCHLTKLETALDQFRKTYPKLKPADAGLLASALTLTGRHALALYEGAQYKWPEDYDKLTHAMVGQLEMVQQGIDTTKKATKGAAEEEPVLVSVGLAPNISAGENLLEGRDDLKTLLSDVIQEGVEFVYSGMDLGWQWALDRVNWSTVSGGELSRRIKIKASFTEGAIGMEMGTGTKKRSSKKAVVAAEPEPAKVEAEAAKPEPVAVTAEAKPAKAEKEPKTPVAATKTKAAPAAEKTKPAPAPVKAKATPPPAKAKPAPVKAKPAPAKAKAPAPAKAKPAPAKAKAAPVAAKGKAAPAPAKGKAAPAKGKAAPAKAPAKAKAAPAKAKAKGK